MILPRPPFEEIPPLFPCPVFGVHFTESFSNSAAIRLKFALGIKTAIFGACQGGYSGDD